MNTTTETIQPCFNDLVSFSNSLKEYTYRVFLNRLQELYTGIVDIDTTECHITFRDDYIKCLTGMEEFGRILDNWSTHDHLTILDNEIIVHLLNDVDYEIINLLCSFAKQTSMIITSEMFDQNDSVSDIVKYRILFADEVSRIRRDNHTNNYIIINNHVLNTLRFDNRLESNVHATYLQQIDDGDFLYTLTGQSIPIYYSKIFDLFYQPQDQGIRYDAIIASYSINDPLQIHIPINGFGINFQVKNLEERGNTLILSLSCHLRPKQSMFFYPQDNFHLIKLSIKNI